MCGKELVGGLIVHVLRESRQGRGGDVIHPGPVKHLHDLLTGVGHGDHPTCRFWLRPCSARSVCLLKPGVRAKTSRHELRQRSLTEVSPTDRTTPDQAGELDM